jgi:hypothetical protein
MSSIASSIVRDTRCGPGSSAAPTSFSTYLATTSTSRLTGAPGAAVPEGGALERLRDQRHGEPVPRPTDVSGDAVDGDRALLDT